MTRLFLHRFPTTLTRPLYPAFWVGPGTSVKLCGLG
uniref:Uncharacterized protein n=1 Tax=Anguilla anguilla TaxID=7936 RepID=A0A0E9RAV7_ANGAN